MVTWELLRKEVTGITLNLPHGHTQANCLMGLAVYQHAGSKNSNPRPSWTFPKETFSWQGPRLQASAILSWSLQEKGSIVTSDHLVFTPTPTDGVGITGLSIASPAGQNCRDTGSDGLIKVITTQM